jgi:hypothetical protein
MVSGLVVILWQSPPTRFSLGFGNFTYKNNKPHYTIFSGKIPRTLTQINDKIIFMASEKATAKRSV